MEIGQREFFVRAVRIVVVQAPAEEQRVDPRRTPGYRVLHDRELAPLAGHYPAVRLGPPWWFHDSIEGMRRYRAQLTRDLQDDVDALLALVNEEELRR